MSLTCVTYTSVAVSCCSASQGNELCPSFDPTPSQECKAGSGKIKLTRLADIGIDVLSRKELRGSHADSPLLNRCPAHLQNAYSVPIPVFRLEAGGSVLAFARISGRLRIRQDCPKAFTPGSMIIPKYSMLRRAISLKVAPQNDQKGWLGLHHSSP